MIGEPEEKPPEEGEKVIGEDAREPLPVAFEAPTPMSTLGRTASQQGFQEPADSEISGQAQERPTGVDGN